MTFEALGTARHSLGSLGRLCAALSFIVGCSSSIDGPRGGADAGATNGSSGSATGGSGASTPGSGGSAGTQTPTGGTGTGGSGGSMLASGGTSGSGGAGGTSVGPLFPNPPPFEAAPALLRRLTRTQFRNSLHDVFGFDVDTSALDSDSWDDNFAVIGASSVVTSELGAEQYETAVESAVNSVFGTSSAATKFLGCTPTGKADDACLRGFLQTLGRRAWRRPLTTSEVDRLAAVAAGAATTLGTAVEGARWATVALFASPNFLYRPELGAPAAGGSQRLTGYEMASRLAFLVWNSLPDDALLDQAASGALDTTDGVRTAVGRLLDAPAGREAASAFAEEFMRLDRLATQAKDPSLYPEYAAALQQGMARDVRDTWAVIAFDDRTSLLDLFSTPKVVVNKELAALYGLDTSGLTSTTFAVRSLPQDGTRLGVLSKAGFLSEFANQKEGSPTLRGRFMVENLLCTPIPNPPPNVNTMLVEPPADTPMTKRQRLELHRSSPTCAGCHAAMDPLGLPLESFDAIGRFRTMDDGLPIDPSGSFDEVDVADARGLGQAISVDPAVADCLLRKYYAYATGHTERDADGSVLNTLADAFRGSGYQLRDLVVAVATHDAFATVVPQP